MPSIGAKAVLRENPRPVFAGIYGDPVPYSSPDEKWVLVFSDSEEFRMSVYMDRISLLHNGEDVTADQLSHEAERLRRGIHLREADYWSADGDHLVYLLWGKEPLYELYLHQLSTKTTRAPVLPDIIRSLRWSPNRNLLLVLYDEQGIVLDANGSINISVTWEKRRLARRTAGWHPSGDFFFVAFFRREDEGVQLNYYRTDTGALTDSIVFDPLMELPYDHKAFANIALDKVRLNLIKPDGSHVNARGNFINEWSSFWFDKLSNRLILSGVRPVGAPYDNNGKLTCHAEELYLAVSLAK